MKKPPLHAGYCTECDKPVWARAWAQKAERSQNIVAGQEFILWPRPDSLYAVLEMPDDGEAPGIAFCRKHAPAPGTLVLEGFGPVKRLEGAYDRYWDWFNPARELFWRTWLRDALNYEQGRIDFVLDAWSKDRL